MENKLDQQIQQDIDNALNQSFTQQSSINGMSGPLDKLKNDIESAKLLQSSLIQKIGSSSSPIDKLNTDREFTFLVGGVLKPSSENSPSSSGLYGGSLPDFPSWPHALETESPGAPGYTKKGFLAPELAFGLEGVRGTENYSGFSDWRGFTLVEQPYNLKTDQRVKRSVDMPKTAQERVENPYSMRDIPLVFGDWRQDYFKHGLHTIYGKTPIENPPDGQSTLRFDQFDRTPFEQNDPVMFGFDIVFDTISSPLLNGSLLDFIANYNGYDEIWSRRQVYEEFKHQFQKFFRTTVPLKINSDFLAITKTGIVNGNPAESDGSSNSNFFEGGKKNYLGYYIKKISGLDFLIEQNKGTEVKYVPDYKKDMITLETMEDVSLSMGTLAHLYKNLYWSRPNGKILFPENLLRFNCFIIISECRNFNRVIKSQKSGNLNIVKDNVSRWVYNLKECQFYFDKMPLPNDIDLGTQGPQLFETYNINFDFKYSTVKFERFVPSGQWGRYVGYDAGAMWKIGNKGTRTNRGPTSSTEYSTPKFFTVGPQDAGFGGTNDKPWFPNLQENGVTKPFVFQTISKNLAVEEEDFTLDSSIKEVKKDGSISDPSQPPPKIETSENQNQQNNSNVGAQPSNLISNETNSPQSEGLKNFEKQSETNSQQIRVQSENLKLSNAKLLLNKSMTNIPSGSNGTSNVETTNSEQVGVLSNLRKSNLFIKNPKVPSNLDALSSGIKLGGQKLNGDKFNVGNILNQATSFVSDAQNK
ncbi:hypothetical protein EBU95_15805, partial [bacterium]|nr:hypothetical protein [bacterium]